jgi:RHS repeat-associated protein
MLTDATGEPTAKFTYDAYGDLEASTGSQTTPFGYAGQYTLSESGLQYLRARVYDPATGQFLTRDPIEALTRQPYSYAGDNPPRSSDPSGLEEIREPCVWPCAPPTGCNHSAKRFSALAREMNWAEQDIDGVSLVALIYICHSPH